MRYASKQMGILSGLAGILLLLPMVGCAPDDGSGDDLAEENHAPEAEQTAPAAVRDMDMGKNQDAIEPLNPSSAAAARPGCADFFQGNIFISVLRPNFTPPTSADRKVIGIDRAGTRNRDRAILANYDPNAPNQRWSFRLCYLDGGTYLQLKNQKSGLCLDKSLDTPNGNGNAVYQYTCSDGGDNQLWIRVPGAGSRGNWQYLVNRSGGRCLDIQNRRYVNGAYLVQWDCFETHTQQWNAF